MEYCKDIEDYEFCSKHNINYELKYPDYKEIYSKIIAENDKETNEKLLTETDITTIREEHYKRLKQKTENYFKTKEVCDDGMCYEASISYNINYTLKYPENKEIYRKIIKTVVDDIFINKTVKALDFPEELRKRIQNYFILHKK